MPGITRKQINELVQMTLQDYPLPCKREYRFGPYPECKTCSFERQRWCILSPFANGEGEFANLMGDE